MKDKDILKKIEEFEFYILKFKQLPLSYKMLLIKEIKKIFQEELKNEMS